MEQKPGMLISIIHRKAHQRMASKLKGYDIDAGQFFFLRYLFKNQGITQEEMVKYLYLDKATVSKGIKKLEQLGYITRNINSEDKRKNCVYPNEKAILIRENMDRFHNEIRDYLFHALNKEEYRQLGKILKKIVDHIV